MNDHAHDQLQLMHSVDLDGIVDRLGRDGWVVVPDFLSPELTTQLAAETQSLWQEGCFRQAGIGRGENLEIRPEVRNDNVMWIDPLLASPAQQRYFQIIEALRLSINRMLMLGLFDFEGHLAVYPPGAYYRKHIDQFRDIGARQVTCILYLNQDWRAEDGGILRLYLDEEQQQDILPLGGQLVLFLSARYYHEVLPATRNRMSLTGWFRRRES